MPIANAQLACHIREQLEVSPVRHPVIMVTGSLIVGLAMIGLVLTVVSAAISGQPFYGVSYKGLPLGTYSTLAVLVLAAAIAFAAGVARVLSFARRRPARSSRT